MRIQARVGREWADTGDGPTCDARYYRLLAGDGALLGEFPSFCQAVDAHNAAARRVSPSYRFSDWPVDPEG